MQILCRHNCEWVNPTITHGFKINLKEDDLCLCFRSETTSHFFLDFFLYQVESENLFNKISDYLPSFKTFSKSKKLEIILSGFNLTNIEPDQRNISVAFAAQNFILKTICFCQLPPNLPPCRPIMPFHHNHHLYL